ncbi:hypothetical protein [Xanthomonas hortorum]|uniref:hypothetical protein n=1 Tax=Xanthomonas hortorum TaxID=56454 RepID=UPI003F7D5064
MKNKVKNPSFSAGVLVVAIALSSAAEAQSYFGFHRLAIGIPNRSNVNSVYVTATGSNNFQIGTCVRTPRGDNRSAVTWTLLTAPSLVTDGTPVRLLGFASTECTNTLLRRRSGTVPNADNLENYWFLLK